MRHRIATLCFFIILIVMSVSFIGFAQSTYEIATDEQIQVPAQTINFQGEHKIDSIGITRPGETLSVQTTAPASASYDLYLINAEGNTMVDPKTGEGPDTFAFDVDGFTAGSYVLAIYQDGDYRTIQPVIIQGYQVETSMPETVQNSLEVNVSLTNVADVESPSAVNVVVANGETDYRSEAEKQSSGEYRTTISLADAPRGDYRVYAIAQGSDNVAQTSQKEILGISTANTVTLQDQQTTTEESSDPAAQSPTTQETTTVQTTTPTTMNTTESSTSQPTQTRTTPPNTPVSTTTRLSQTTDSPTSTTTAKSIITPNPTTTEQTARKTTSPSTPVVGFNTVTALIALLSGLYLLQRYRV